MKPKHDSQLAIAAAPYVARLRRLPYLKVAGVEEPREREKGAPDLVVRLQFADRNYPLAVQLKRMPRLNRMAVDALKAVRLTPPYRYRAVFAPHVTPAMGNALAAAGWNFVDLVGNVRLELEPGLVFHVEGKRPEKSHRQGRGFGAPGYRALFAILVRPAVADLPVGEAAEWAGVGRTTYAYAVERLVDEGLLRRSGRRLVVEDRAGLIDRWVAGYHDTLRPRLVRGIYRTPWVPAELEGRVASLLGEQGASGTRWAWGGGAAALRIGGYYRGEQTTVHVEPPYPELIRQLDAIPARRGELVVLGVPGPLAFESAVPDTVHPLLAYAELADSGNERAREAAVDLRNRFLLDAK